MDYAREVIYLAGCAVNGIIPDKSRVEGVDPVRLYAFAEAHTISALVAVALESAGLKHDVFTRAKAKAMRRAVIFSAEYSRLSDALESAEIWHIPLKGVVLRDYYPSFWVREMSDIDILFDATRAHDVREIMKGLGFKVMEFGIVHHDTYYKLPVVNIEMHRELFGAWPDKIMHEYYYGVKAKLIPDSGKKYTYHFSPEDFYLYMTAHACKHYHEGGTGIRSLLDVYVYMRKFSGVLDMEYISRESVKLGMSEFESGMRELAQNLFGGENLTAENESMLEYVISSGTYGTIQSATKNEVNSFGGGVAGKIKYVLRKIFPSFEKVKALYPFYYRHKYLYPVLVVWRLLKALTVKRKRVKAEIMSLKEE